jgi:phage tail sheath protein FI
MTYKTPGVYVEEIPLFPPSVAEVETAIPAFIGYTAIAEKDGQQITEPLAIRSLKEYEQYFGKSAKEPDGTFEISINETQDENKKRTGIAGVVTTKADKFPQYNLYYSMQLFFANGGGKCYIVSAGTFPGDGSGAPDSKNLTDAIDKLQAYDEPTMIVVPEGIYLDDDKYKTMIETSIKQCAKMKDRFAIVDVKQQKDKKPETDAAAFRGKSPSDFAEIRYAAAYYPYLVTTIDRGVDIKSLKVKDHKVNGQDATDNSLAGKTMDEVKKSANDVYNVLKAEISKATTVVLPPSPAMAGIYARVDSSRGVWKAPANVSVASVSAPDVIVTHDQQAELNVDPTAGKSINVIRSFSGRGTIVWGGRTLDGNSAEWRYINVRRFFNMVEESVQKSTVWAVFEPNTKNTWVMVKSMIENYLITKWQEGSLAGAKPEDAFYVKVGLGITMTADDILNGIMNVEIGMAVARPAEFIVLKFSHKMQVS